ncbi:nuclear transport factor 2 family protein [Muriicola sp. Z0-33]|uniref:nuclear transport factor 2 family protein n=1 Tax=Muriicola sp. Z0-33 TaxID=2816957 RepID=UPI002237908E|nr:nuclear transport factor 2 family protein [Muriicola sp. Z0-33]MCW5516370.1 nuclear transport factor 2 family protein [Muriicola sp. Z0-33]
MRAAIIYRLNVLGLLLFMVLGCKDINKKDALALANYKPNLPAQSTDNSPNLKWKKWVNSALDSLPHLYTENAYKIASDGTIIQGKAALLDHYKKQEFQIEEIRTKIRITAVLNTTIQYEIGGFSTTDKADYSHLIIWRKGDGVLKRELEMIVKGSADVPTSALNEIEKRREEWIRLCQLHKAEDLVNALYSEHTLYYNHRPMIIGRNAVIQEYQYMNNPNYNLHLTPIEIKLVSPNIAYEIGQCSGSYPGNYVLIWHKALDGEWRILMDSNI